MRHATYPDQEEVGGGLWTLVKNTELLDSFCFCFGTGAREAKKEPPKDLELVASKTKKNPGIYLGTLCLSFISIYFHGFSNWTKRTTSPTFETSCVFVFPHLLDKLHWTMWCQTSWYSSHVTHSVGIHGLRPTWPYLIVKILTTQTKFL